MSRPDPGSFRDPASRITLEQGRVLRLLDRRGLAGWEALKTSALFDRAVADGRLVETRQVEDTKEGWAATLEHPTVPFISYPYEWTFSMMRDAALLQLDLLAEALAEGLTIKDATPFNIQFVRGRPVFIDIGSFEPYQAGEPWIGYRQFTRQFLFPLLLSSWAGVPFQPWLRGDMEGPTAADMRRLLSFGQRLRPAAMLHVSLQARMEERMSGMAVREGLRSAGFSAEMILANVRKLRGLVEGLEWSGVDGAWSGYQGCDHVGRDREAKGAFLRAALDAHHPDRVLDLGANDGYFSEIASGAGAVAIAVDGDEPVLDALHRRGTEVSLALSDLTNPSPSQGWAGVERPALVERAAPDLVVAYGLIHHLIYTASIPPASVLDWLTSLGCPIVLEFVAPGDEMVARLIANKTPDELHGGRTLPEFEALTAERWHTIATHELEGGTRKLFSLVPV